MNDVFVRELTLPARVRGITVPNPDGTFSVYLNAALPEEARREALEHELYHIRHDHLYRCAPVASCEQAAAHRLNEPQPETPAAKPEYGYVRLFGNVLLWKRLGENEQPAQIAPEDLRFRPVYSPRRRVPACSIDLYDDRPRPARRKPNEQNEVT